MSCWASSSSPACLKGAGRDRGLAPGRQTPPPKLGAGDDGPHRVRRRVPGLRGRARRRTALALRARSVQRRRPYPSTNPHPPTLTAGGPMNGVRPRPYRRLFERVDELGGAHCSASSSEPCSRARSRLVNAPTTSASRSGSSSSNQSASPNAAASSSPVRSANWIARSATPPSKAILDTRASRSSASCSIRIHVCATRRPCAPTVSRSSSPRSSTFKRRGIVARRHRELAGQLLPQPTVATDAGRRLPLDDVLGAGFALIGLGLDPAEQLDPPSQRLLTCSPSTRSR